MGPETRLAFQADLQQTLYSRIAPFGIYRSSVAHPTIEDRFGSATDVLSLCFIISLSTARFNTTARNKDVTAGPQVTYFAGGRARAVTFFGGVSRGGRANIRGRGVKLTADIALSIRSSYYFNLARV